MSELKALIQKIIAIQNDTAIFCDEMKWDALINSKEYEAAKAKVEASSDGDTLSLGCFYGFVQMAQESAISGSTMTVYRTDGSTSLGTKTVQRVVTR